MHPLEVTSALSHLCLLDSDLLFKHMTQLDQQNTETISLTENYKSV